jgi:hypothetical protein
MGREWLERMGRRAIIRGITSPAIVPAQTTFPASLRVTEMEDTNPE